MPSEASGYPLSLDDDNMFKTTSILGQAKSGFQLLEKALKPSAATLAAWLGVSEDLVQS